MKHLFKYFNKDETGATAAEFSFLTSIMIVSTLGLVELSTAFFQYHETQKAARIGARLAAANDPVASDMFGFTGLSGSVNAGDPMPDYVRSCSAGAQTCSSGTYDDTAMRRIIFGPDGDNACANVSQKARMGMCDVQRQIRAEHVTVEYRNSGLDRAGNPPQLAPMITVRVTGLEFQLNLLNGLIPSKLRQMPDIEVTVLAEDLRSDA